MNELPRALKHLTVWLLLILLVFLSAQALLRARAQPRVVLQGGSVVLQRAADGHFHWPAQVNGTAVLMLVDTGATRSTLPGALARELQLPEGALVQTQTAAGPAQGYTSQVDLQLQGGPQLQRWPVTVLDRMTGPPLLGMDVLGQLRIEQDGPQMRLSPR